MKYLKMKIIDIFLQKNEYFYINFLNFFIIAKEN